MWPILSVELAGFDRARGIVAAIFALYRTSGDTDKPIVLYEYTPNRKPENAEKFLAGFHRYLHADGYQGYHNLSAEITVVGCMAHARRKLIEALESIPEEKRNNCEARTGLMFMQKLYDIEGELHGVPAEEIYHQRQEQSKPVFEAMLSWAKTVKAPPKSHLGKAVYYLSEQEPYLRIYLEEDVWRLTTIVLSGASSPL